MGKKKEKKKRINLTHCPHCTEAVLQEDFYCKNCKVILEDYKSGKVPIKNKSL